MFTRPVHRGTRLRLLVAVLAIVVSLPTAVAAANQAPGTGTSGATSQSGARDLYIVVQMDAPVALYQGGIAGLEATNPEARGEVKLDANSAASRAYRDYLRTTRARLLDALSAAFGRDLQAVDHYDVALNGFSVELTAAEADAVRSTPGVALVTKNETLPTLTDAGPQWMNADDVWDGSAVSGAASKGERIVAGIIDTGVQSDHPSFAEVGGDGYVHQNPRGRYYGVCAATPPPLPDSKCNNKLIGMYDFTGSGEEDDVGHGSHTASTVAGNVVDATIFAPTTTIGPARISGVAPHANVISYKACMAGTLNPGGLINLGSCPLNALIAAIDQASADVVDVINFSIGGGSVNPWSDPLGLSFFGAHAAGTFVAASAGNTGPNPQTIGRPSNSPWLLSVGASTHDRRPTGNVTATKTNGDSLEIIGMSLTSDLGPTALVDAKAIGNELCNPFTAAQMAEIAGKIVICTQGVIGRVQKGINARDGGAAGMILTSQPGYKNSVFSDTHVIPTVMIGEWDGDALRAWLAGAENPQAALDGVTIESNADFADRMAGFSSRGPDLNMDDVIKPDVTAPGVAIWAAWMEDGTANADYQMIQGTSMSSPHAAGAGALLRALHRDWTPDQIKSALMSTGFSSPSGGKESVSVTKEDHSTPADPFDMGGGRIDLAQAARPGFTVAESVAGYQAANPALGGQASALNIASVANSNCIGSCSWTRTLVSTSDRSITYNVTASAAPGVSLSVSPSTFTLDPIQGPTIAPGLGDPSLPGTQTITITATVSGVTPGQWRFGEIRFDADAAGLADQHFPVAIKVAGAAPAPDCEIPETVVSSSPAALNVAPYNDVREVRLAGLYPRYDGQPLPNARFELSVTGLGVNGALPPNQHWRITFAPPNMAAGLSSHFVQMLTDTTGQASFVYGTINTSNQFTVLGAPEAGSYSLADNTISWTIAANKIGNPQVGDTLNNVIGSSGAAQPGTLTTNLKSTPAGTYTLTTCDAAPPTPTPTATATPTPTPTATPTPTPSPEACTLETADHAYFLGVAYDSEQREDFIADARNFEFFLQTLRGTYCIPDSQATILNMENNFTDPQTGKTYAEASEANVKAELRRLGAAASQHEDSLFFFFLSSHGIMYTSAGWTGGPSECPIERTYGSLSGLKAGGGETGDFFDCELGTELNQNFAPTTRMFIFNDCSFCGGFSDSLTAASGTVPDGSVPAPSGILGANRIVMTGCAITTECFGSGGPNSGTAADGGVSYRHMRNVLEGEPTCDGWTVPGFPTVEGIDLPVQGEPFRALDGRCTASEWFLGAVWSAYQTIDPIAIQQQFRIKYGMASLDDDILIFEGDAPNPTPTPPPTPTPTPTVTPTPDNCVTTNWLDTLEPAAHPDWRTGTASNELSVTSPTWSVTLDTGAHSPTNSWSNDARTLGLKDTRLIAPTQKIGRTTQLSFWHRFLMEAGFDGGVLEVSTDSGKTWVDVTSLGSFVSGGYNGTISSNDGSAIAGRRAWTGGSDTARLDEMGQVVVSLGGFVPAGAQSVNAQIRWRFVGDPLVVGSTPGDEWWVDDVQFSNVVVSCS